MTSNYPPDYNTFKHELDDFDEEPNITKHKPKTNGKQIKKTSS